MASLPPSRIRRVRKQTFRNRKEERFRVAAEIDEQRFFPEIPCDECLGFGSICAMAPNPEELGSSKCSECLRLNRPCSFRSWPSLDRTRNHWKSRISETEAERDRLFRELSKVQARLDQEKEILTREQEKAKEKTKCLVTQLSESGEDLAARDLRLSADLQTELFSPWLAVKTVGPS